MSDVPRAARPCPECPFRLDAVPGKFTPERYEALACTVGEPGREAPIGAPMFACHATPEGREHACAGWLAVCGHDHIGVRLAVATGALPGSALEPGEGWPELHGSYAEVCRVNDLDAPSSDLH